jgi:RNA polymerase sigma-70 factor (ECF subfamily)
MLATELPILVTVIGVDTRNARGSKKTCNFQFSICPVRTGRRPRHSESARAAIRPARNFHQRRRRSNLPAFVFEGNDMNSTAGELIQQRLPQWRAYAQSLTRNRAAAEDLVQDTVVRVLTSMDRFDGTNFKGWSNTILHNRFIDDRRRARFQGGSVEDLPIAATAQKATQDLDVELVETLTALDEISPEHREIIILIGIKELSYARTARRLKIPMGTVRSRLSRARAELLTVVDGERRLGRRAEARRRRMAAASAAVA